MRQLIRSAALLAIAAVTCVAAQAQVTGPVRFGIGIGTSIPTGQFGDRVNTGYLMDGHVIHHFAGTPLGIRADLAYSHYGFTTSYLDRFQFADAGGASIWSGTLDLTLNLALIGAMRPYLIGGGGVYRRHISVERAVGQGVISVFDPFFGFTDEVFTEQATIRSRTQTKLGLNGGAGVRFLLGPVRTYVEVQYDNAYTDTRNTGFVPITFGFEW
jgi:opacity protein-like surface antigen